jgi:hypothetical protein
MVQAARSGVQNIAEGSQASGTSKKTELKLTNVARASLEELRLDYEDFLRQRGLPMLPPGHPALMRFKKKRCATLQDVQAWVAEEVERQRTDEQGRARTGVDAGAQDTDSHELTRTRTDAEARAACPPGREIPDTPASPSVPVRVGPCWSVSVHSCFRPRCQRCPFSAEPCLLFARPPNRRAGECLRAGGWLHGASLSGAVGAPAKNAMTGGRTSGRAHQQAFPGQRSKSGSPTVRTA